MKDQKFVKTWERTRRCGKSVYMIKFTLGSFIAIGITDFIIFHFFGFDELGLYYSFFIFGLYSISAYFNWDKNEDKYLQLQKTK